jgi:hypothetical protein
MADAVHHLRYQAVRMIVLGGLRADLPNPSVESEDDGGSRRRELVFARQRLWLASAQADRNGHSPKGNATMARGSLRWKAAKPGAGIVRVSRIQISFLPPPSGHRRGRPAARL